MKKKINDCIIVIPLHLPLNYPCDYLDQTAKILAKNNLIVLFDFRNPTHWLTTLKEIGKLTKSIRFLLNGRVRGQTYYRPFSFFPTRNIPFIFKINRLLGIFQLRFLLFLKRKKIIVWGFDPVIEPMIGKLGERLRIYDCIDFLGEDEYTKSAKEPEKRLFEKVDIVVFNSRGLYDQKINQNGFPKKKSLVTVCGCNIDLFQNKVKGVPNDLKQLKGIKILLSGNFDYRLDIDLLNYIVNQNPVLNFIFIGPILKDASKEFLNILKKKNVCYFGKKKKEELPAYYQNSNVGIIPYKTSLNFVKYSNPMKTYEYLASGIPVVSTKIEALKQYPEDLVYTTNDYDNFSRALNNMISNWNNKKVTRAKQIAKINSWDNKVAKIEEFILNQKYLF